MKRSLAAALCLLLACAQTALASTQIKVTQLEDAQSGSTLAFFSAEPDARNDTQNDAQAEPDAAQLAAGTLIEARFAQQKALAATKRGQVVQHGSVYQDGRIASMALRWQGEQPDGSEGSTALGLTVDLATGEEIPLAALFDDAVGALAAMEAIVQDDVLDGMSDYMEYGDLLPMPTDQYFVDAHGLTVCWPEDRYRYFDGTSGSVTFYWHEIADFVGEDSPVYALAHTETPDPAGAIARLCESGALGEQVAVALGGKLGDAAQAYPLADPDYTTEALVYPLERVRGWAVEIPKYAETEEAETPVTAIRASRISLAGALTTKRTTRAQIEALLGEPQTQTQFDEDAAADALLCPGTSL